LTEGYRVLTMFHSQLHANMH